MKRAMILGLIFLATFATATWADKVDTRTYFAASMSDVLDFRIVQNADGTVDGYLRATVRASDGKAYVATYITRLTPAQVTSVATFISTQLLTSLNKQEGL